mmetsp:Transcript_20381/g.69079  ORF Transcript_20381/g.69079 Transcript_20381/m.69079 type:complete len:205 (+) Transcript_20381:396-1010(+)
MHAPALKLHLQRGAAPLPRRTRAQVGRSHGLRYRRALRRRDFAVCHFHGPAAAAHRGGVYARAQRFDVRADAGGVAAGRGAGQDAAGEEGVHVAARALRPRRRPARDERPGSRRGAPALLRGRGGPGSRRHVALEPVRGGRDGADEGRVLSGRFESPRRRHAAARLRRRLLARARLRQRPDDGIRLGQGDAALAELCARRRCRV